MKKNIFPLIIGFLGLISITSTAQEVQTLYFLENAPMRHTINPAFQPASNFYLTLPVIGHTSLWAGTNGWTMSDFVFKGPQGNTITPFHPDAPTDWLSKKPDMFSLDADINLSILGFGFRIKDFGYLHVNVSEHLYMDANVSTSLFELNNLNTLNPTTLSLGTNISAYTDIALGYSHKINNQWSVGGKIKFLVGQANISAAINNLTFSSTQDSTHLDGRGEIYAAAPLQWQNFPSDLSKWDQMDLNSLLFAENADIKQKISDILEPSGLGVALDLGVTYKPIKNLQVTASVTDLGFIRWHRHAKASLSVDTAYYGNNDIDLDSLGANIGTVLEGFKDALHVSNMDNTLQPRLSMLTANLNVGVDANFWKNRIGVGIYSRTRFYHNRITEEVTIGASIRPCNWFQLAASYSIMNGYSSNMGVAISLAPYDGIMLTLASDYVPLTYAKASTENGNMVLPYKTPGVNLSFGIAIVAGTNPSKKDKDKDGVLDRIDVCLPTPLNVRVDEMGCPLDADGDGVADYIDECPYTPSAAYGLIDSIGCPLDTDGDGVPDFRDLCPNTPAEGIALVDQDGCLLDSDGDGIHDYIDQCPNTPIAAKGMTDSVGCPLDTDGDGVYDYMDLCADTPQEAFGLVDQNGCPLDTDKDNVYDYCDKCPNTIPEARRYVDAEGCMLDTDNDSIFDYEDLCPTIPGVKENKGCPEIKREIRNILNKAMQGIQFENGKATIKKKSYNILNNIAQIFIDNPSYIIEVQGHTDNVGQHDYNIDLSDRRAHTVRTYLINKGVPATRITAHGYGPDVPIDTNETAEGRAKNRRVEFKITFEEITYETVYDRVQNTESIYSK